MDIDQMEIRLRGLEERVSKIERGNDHHQPERMDPELHRQIHAPLNVGGVPVAQQPADQRPQAPLTARQSMPGEGDVAAQQKRNEEVSAEQTVGADGKPKSEEGKTAQDAMSGQAGIEDGKVGPESTGGLPVQPEGMDPGPGVDGRDAAIDPRHRSNPKHRK